MNVSIYCRHHNIVGVVTGVNLRSYTRGSSSRSDDMTMASITSLTCRLRRYIGTVSFLESFDCKLLGRPGLASRWCGVDLHFTTPIPNVSDGSISTSFTKPSG